MTAILSVAIYRQIIERQIIERQKNNNARYHETDSTDSRVLTGTITLAYCRVLI